MTDPRHVLLIAAKHILRYLKGTVDQRINLEGDVDSDWAGSAIDRKSTSGCFFSMILGEISWFSRKQSCMALSIAKEKYVATCLDTWERGAVKLHFVIQIKIYRKRES